VNWHLLGRQAAGSLRRFGSGLHGEAHRYGHLPFRVLLVILGVLLVAGAAVKGGRL
jgi:hypothetical protein